MKTNPNTPARSSDANLQNDRRRLKTSPSPAQFSPPSPKKPEEPILPFQCSEYTFLNQCHSEVAALKTVISISLNTQKLQKIVQLNHPNIIAIRKIVKSSPRDSSPQMRAQTHFSFYYEPVHFSLRYLSEHPEEQPRLFNLLLTLDLRATLSSLVDYLEEGSIFFVPRLQDLGISNEGILKIYISPLVVFDSRYDAAGRRSVGAIAQWWQNYQRSMGSNMFRKEKKVLQLQPPKLATISDLSLQQASFTENNLERELGELLDDEVETAEVEVPPSVLLKESTSSFSKIGSVQLEKIKKIDQEIKFIRERLNNNNQKQAGLKESYNSVEMKDMRRQLGKPLESKAGEGKEAKESANPNKNNNNNYYRQPIQQNINCINIYNHNNHISPKQIAALPNYIPKHQQIMQKHYYDPNVDPQFFRDHDEDYSQDTYDIEFDAQFQPPQDMARNNYRNTIISPNERELSEYSQHVHKKKNESKAEMKGKGHANQVCNKNYTESAGPLQFKSFVNKYMKPSREEGEASKESEQTYPQSQLSQEHSGSNYTQPNRTASVEKGLKKQFGRSKVESLCEHNADIKRIYSQNQFSTYSRPLTTGESEIEEKVKKALQKTKNAIALLNRVKSSKAMSRPTTFQ